MTTEEHIAYWTDYSFEVMRKDGIIMPTIISKILGLKEFINSGVTEEELRQSIKIRFADVKAAIVKSLREKLK